MSAFCMSTLLFPPTLADELQWVLNSFWLGKGAEPRKGIKWARWDKLCAHKSNGGMGFRNSHIFNLVMLGKIDWMLFSNPDAPISHILKAIYYPRGNYLNVVLGQSPSYTWRSICAA